MNNPQKALVIETTFPAFDLADASRLYAIQTQARERVSCFLLDFGDLLLHVKVAGNATTVGSDRWREGVGV